MSKKTLNQTNLATLGGDRLAALLIEVSTGNATIQRRLRLELSHNLGAGELARDVRKRLVSLRKSRSHVSWRKRRTLVADLQTQAEMITERIAPEEPVEAFDLLWQFIDLAGTVYERVDDSRGEVGDVFRAALLHFADIGPRAGLKPEPMADRIWDALQNNGYGEWDGIIAILAPVLGDTGLRHLKVQVEAYAQLPPEPDETHEAIHILRRLRIESSDYLAERKAQFVRLMLREIAQAQGDTDAYAAQFTAEQLARPGIAADVAQRLLAEGRDQDALSFLGAAERPTGKSRTYGQGQADWDAAYVACLTALGRGDDAQAHRWECFTVRLDARYLRAYLKALPDFDDIEAEDRARAVAMAFDDPHVALAFFIDWPDLASAAQLVTTRAAELDGDFYHILTPAAEALRDRYPLAAVLLWRRMIDFALFRGRSSRYGHAADHLNDCTALDAGIAEYGTLPTHQTYLEGLRSTHARKSSFWDRVGGPD
ncbi:DUF6880 family protein [Puniceibacterium sp. IMCC21224]|uniref:DUF6880 family protein n=1 Tax=Puniceibacterium sp. IMCC21224 TaxID=1618204 RepID=UPI00064DE9E0|nr:DUF6880 family protein [Puniceibacterium sp. IMCC21224]KMK68779.1 hypothetical protein IMCC21224_113665 [Puniceibacterium sp. IMCC21224]